jgi:GNAT superfamily N-acetyltransferase
MRIRLLDDIEEARAIHALAFEEDLWVGDQHTFWVMTEKGRTVGFCSAVMFEELGNVYLSRSAVVKAYQGRGVQRRMVHARVNWGIEHGAKRAVTYTLMRNYPSMVTLLNCGFRFYTPDDPWVGKNVHYFRKIL